MFKQFSHKKISILNGGLKYWKLNNKKLETSEPQKNKKSQYIAKLDRSKIKRFEDIENNIKHKKFKLIDARPSGRFNGIDPEPRIEIKSGNIKDSINIPFSSVINSETGCFKDQEELEKIFDKNQVKEMDDIVFSCGSGVAACVVGSAYNTLSHKDGFDLFDGSWTEWALRNNLKN
jgi:thiosulfate/3-mercaptopyruvate sulfurtransferase